MAEADSYGMTPSGKKAAHSQQEMSPLTALCESINLWLPYLDLPPFDDAKEC